jgi:hypothetical protein
MSQAFLRDFGSFHTAKFADQADAVAAGAGDATESNGVYVDARGYGSASLWAFYEAVLAEDETLTLTANAQDASDGSGTGVADFGTAYAATVVATGGTGGSTERGAVRLADLNLAGSAGYLRSQVTPNLSNSATDTLRLQLVWVFGPGAEIPVS